MIVVAFSSRECNKVISDILAKLSFDFENTIKTGHRIQTSFRFRNQNNSIFMEEIGPLKTKTKH